MDDENSAAPEKIFNGVANDITFQESDDISARDDNNMFRFINLGERETLSVIEFSFRRSTHVAQKSRAITDDRVTRTIGS
ncbi:hypothetical protein RRG08_035700 [Elysia crispata]|uniref:Uncharacterized protein n=1 Tax=Elysia crispata TaxID=231223 RepID=A0AAE0YIT6_9GAST|nr:hypothetical protein RRG08_035700 [Elysia crispata]